MKSCSLFLFLVFFSTVPAFPQGSDGKRDQKTDGWGFELGIRNTYSIFGDESLAPGFGGQFRVQPTDRLNTEWYMDYIKSNIEDLGSRRSLHIGWSVIFYPWKKEVTEPFRPYLLAGHCFDHAKVVPKEIPFGKDPSSQERWSSALQGGAGMHFRLSYRADLSLSAQYMSHLGNELEVERKQRQGLEYIEPVHKEKELSIEGHLLLTMSLNVRILK